MRREFALACLVAPILGAPLEAQALPASSYVSLQPQVRGTGCLQPRARSMISQITARVGPIEITSTCGGRHAHNSQHYRGNAIDFRPRSASVGATLAALRSMPIVGGIGSYGGGLIHADVRAERVVWHGRGRSFASLKRPRSSYASLRPADRYARAARRSR